MSKASAVFVALLILPSITNRTFAQDNQGVGLYAPDLIALRNMVAPTGNLTMPLGKNHDELAAPWAEISEQARELLIHENDLALAVVDREDHWLYRSVGVYTLRSFPDKHKGDQSAIARVVKDPWFRRVRDLYAGRSPGSSGLNRVRVGELLVDVASDANATTAEKDWFRGIVGTEIQSLDKTARSALLQDATYGEQFTLAISVAEGKRKEQLDRIAVWSAGWTTPTSDPHLSILPEPKGFTKTLFHYSESGKGREMEEPLVDFRTQGAGGKEIVSWASKTGTLFVSWKSSAKAIYAPLTSQGLNDILMDRDAKVFLGLPGTADLILIRPPSQAPPPK